MITRHQPALQVLHQALVELDEASETEQLAETDSEVAHHMISLGHKTTRQLRGILLEGCTSEAKERAVRYLLHSAKSAAAMQRRPR